MLDIPFGLVSKPRYAPKLPPACHSAFAWNYKSCTPTSASKIDVHRCSSAIPHCETIRFVATDIRQRITHVLEIECDSRSDRRDRIPSQSPKK